METFIEILGYILVVLIVLFFFGFTIFIHEFGHFIAGRLLGLKAPIFSIGFGPCLWKKKFKNTEFRISLIPLGGYVSLPELDPTGMEMIQGDADQKKESLKPAVWWKRIIVAFAGPFGNILFAGVLALIVYAFYPSQDFFPKEIQFPNNGVTIGYVEPNSEAANMGLCAGDIVYKINDRDVEIPYEFTQEIHLGSRADENDSSATNQFYSIICVSSNLLDTATSSNASEKCLKVPVVKGEKYYKIDGVELAENVMITSVVTNSPAEKVGLKVGDYVVKGNGTRIISTEYFTNFVATATNEIDLTIFRDDKFIDFTVKPEDNIIGVSLYGVSEGVLPWMKYRKPLDQLKGDASSIFRILDSLFIPKQKGESSRTANALGGPISIVTVMWLNVLSGFISFLAFIRYLNLNLAILNLLPIPILDGGHIIFALWRGIFRRELPAKVITIICNLFAVLIIGFFVFVSCNDVGNVYSMFASNDDNEPQATKTETEDKLESETEGTTDIETIETPDDVQTETIEANQVEETQKTGLLDGEYEIVPADAMEIEESTSIEPAIE